VAAVLLFVMVYICLFFVTFACGWIAILWWVSNLPGWFP
jgi:hypothetical protein